MNSLARHYIEKINKACCKIGRPISLMEVCGTHTVAIFKHGIRDVLPEGLRLLSGPGCPVCVTSQVDIDKAIKIAMQKDVIFVTFGDMMKVPGGRKCLSDIKAEGADIRIVYSPMDALKIAIEHPVKKVVFFGAGFETTSPSVAATLFSAEEDEINNFYIFSVFKRIPPALEALLVDETVNVDGFILPGHVSAIIGRKPYLFMAEEYKKCGVITGFEPLDILQSIYLLLQMMLKNPATIEIQYKSVVKEEGNQKAVLFLEQFFYPVSALWRGIGVIPESGFALKKEYNHRDITTIFDLHVETNQKPSSCSCGDILKGIKLPVECKLFGKGCTPEHPVGPCMVSFEGSCSAYYKYGGYKGDG